ncbi:conserved hypothetical protein, secreted [Candidatus Desulfofervidus auxilii]|uniref:Probable pectate lyase C n=1 Tax=Desulfofervidus auxilii TaxID=1621989 RepID=A0A7U4QJC3_DESA2|nr:right-handed parallel beta-helix repeat-containing protein [Candidatus Desulfofervidus auxilii]AMM40423.1 conserved hypothetical protein, secreted [Candidatus Desulfofervidus auxilii]
MKARLLFLVFLVAFLATNVTLGEIFNVTNLEEFQDALTTAESNGEDDIINVAEGTYNITSTLRYSTYDGDSGDKLTIQGAGADKTVLDGGGSVQILYIDTGTDGGDVTIKDMALENGNGGNGGGIYVHGSSINITIKECIFSGNSAEDAGGGVEADSWSGTITIINNIFSRNSAKYGGGVSAHSDSGITIINNTFSENSAKDYGGGVSAHSWSGTVTITNNIFSRNSAKYGGGVDAGSDSGTTIINNTFSGNSASRDGGGIWTRLYYDSAILNIYNNIFFDNTANAGGNDGDDLYVNSDGNGNSTGSTVNLYNNNLSGNANFDTGQSEDLFITETDNYSHGANIQQNPLFVDAENGDFHLESTSPCIDAGTNDAPHLPDKDKDGKPRIIDGDGDDITIVDMGAYEFGDICEGDFDCDGDVDGSDLAIFAADFGRTDCYFTGDCEGDFDYDGDVDGSDLAIFAADFGRTDCPCALNVP